MNVSVIAKPIPADIPNKNPVFDSFNHFLIKNKPDIFVDSSMIGTKITKKRNDTEMICDR